MCAKFQSVAQATMARPKQEVREVRQILDLLPAFFFSSCNREMPSKTSCFYDCAMTWMVSPSSGSASCSPRACAVIWLVSLGDGSAFCSASCSPRTLSGETAQLHSGVAASCRTCAMTWLVSPGGGSASCSPKADPVCGVAGSSLLALAIILKEAVRSLLIWPKAGRSAESPTQQDTRSFCSTSGASNGMSFTSGRRPPRTMGPSKIPLMLSNGMHSVSSSYRIIAYE
mmetsp:Transcript_51396/g.102097  ORF Transcript_51396/g.102097 Transcript_51396/m.102097 type:complete len:228 (+) Transcript_51396:142-825(+)